MADVRRKTLPKADRGDDAVAGHWLLARLGKRVLRPGGAELTRELLNRAEVTDADVLELAPGLGRTATEILARRPRSYLGAGPALLLTTVKSVAPCWIKASMSVAGMPAIPKPPIRIVEPSSTPSTAAAAESVMTTVMFAASPAWPAHRRFGRVVRRAPGERRWPPRRTAPARPWRR